LRSANLASAGTAIAPQSPTSPSYWPGAASDVAGAPGTTPGEFGADTAPRRRSAILLVILSIVYSVVLFIAAAVFVSMLSAFRGGDDAELGKRLAREAAEKFGLMMLFGSISLASLLAYLGWLPGTRRR
jgi:hypothetical protein